MSLKVKLRSGIRTKEKFPPAAEDNVARPFESSGARHSAVYRERLKQNPEEWKQFKTLEAARARQMRRNRTEEQKLIQREQARIRQKRFAAKRKEISEGLKEKRCKPTKVLTRNEADKKREYNRLKKRESRNKMNSQQKRRVREKEAQRRREKREILRQKKTKQKTNDKQDMASTTAGYKTDSARKMAISRLRSKIAKDSEKFADLVAELINGRQTTPKKVAALQARGVETCRKRIAFQAQLSRKIKATYNELKLKSDKESLRKRRLLMSSCLITKKYKLSRELNVRQGYITKLFREVEKTGSVQIRRKARKDSTCLDVVNNIQSFYQLPKIARELPCMRTAKAQQQRFIMEVSIQRAYYMWRAENPEHNVSLSVFQKLRPSHVLLQRFTTLRQCLCEYCTSIMLKLQALNRTLSLCNQKTLIVRDKYDLLNLTMCPKGEQRFHEPKCIERNCEKCGSGLLTEHFLSFSEIHDEKMISWQEWETKTYFHDGKQKSKKVQVTRREKFSVLMRELTEEVSPLAKHVFVANWQADMFTSIKTNLPLRSCVFVMDFAENFRCISQDEIQAAHWAKNQVTVHPIVCFFHCHHELEERSHIAQEALVFISNDLKHDSHLVNHFESRAIQYLKEKKALTFNHIVEFTDGCGAQYKSKNPFSDISFSKQYYGVEIERHFFGSRHGKGPSDGVSGCVKSTVRRAVVSRRATVNSAEDMFTFCNENMQQNNCEKQMRSFFFVKDSDVNRYRPDQEVKSSLRGTRLIHAVRCVKPGILDTRLLSCFCTGCLDNGLFCSNKKYVIPWQRRALDMVVKDLSPESDTSEPASPMENEDLPIVEDVNIEEMWSKLQDSSFGGSMTLDMLDEAPDFCDQATSEIRQTSYSEGTYLKVHHGMETYPVVVDTWPWVKYFSLMKPGHWTIQENRHTILLDDVAGILSPPDLQVTGSRFFYVFSDF